MADLFPPIKGVLTTDIELNDVQAKDEWRGKFLLQTARRVLYYVADDGSFMQVASYIKVGENAFDFGSVLAKALIQVVTGNKDLALLQTDIASLKEQRAASLERNNQLERDIETANNLAKTLNEEAMSLQQQLKGRTEQFENQSVAMNDIMTQNKQLREELENKPAYTMSVQEGAGYEVPDEVRFMRILITKLMNFTEPEMKRLVELQII